MRKDWDETYGLVGYLGGIFFAVSFISWYFMNGTASKLTVICPVNLVNGVGIAIGLLIFVAISYSGHILCLKERQRVPAIKKGVS